MLDSTESIKSDLKRKFNIDTRLFIRMNPKCPHCRKRSYGSKVCLHCGKYPKFPLNIKISNGVKMGKTLWIKMLL